MILAHAYIYASEKREVQFLKPSNGCVERGSSVLQELSLDLSEVLDMIKRFKLFNPLFDAHVPVLVIDAKLNGFCKLHVSVRWTGCLRFSSWKRCET